MISSLPSRSLFVLLLFILSGLADLVIAQGAPPRPTPAAPTPPAPRRPAAAPGGAGDVDGPVEAPPATEDLLQGGMLMPNASVIKVVLPTYQQLTGKRVILDTNIADNNVRIVVNGPITQEDLVDFIERTLLLNGFAFVPTNRENTVKLINAAGGQPLRAQGGRVYTAETPLPETDQVITYVMNLDYIKAEEAARIFPQIIQLNSFGAIATVPGASAIIIYDDVAIVRQLLELKKEVDVSSGLVKPQWFELERADVEKAVEFLNEVLDTGDAGSGAKTTRPVDAGGAPAGIPAAPQPAAGGASQGQQGAGGDEAPAIKIVADPRRNSILAVARPMDLSYIEALLKEFDSPSKARTFLKRPLKFLIATDFLPLVSDALAKEFDTETSGGGGGSGTANRPTNAQRTSSSSRSGSGTSRSSSGVGSSGSGSSGFGGGSSSLGGSLGGSSSSQDLSPKAAESVVIGKTLLVADNERNAIIVSGPPESIRLVEELIDQLDLRPRQVYLATVIGTVDVTNDKEFGISARTGLQKLNDREELLGAGALNIPELGEDFDILDLVDITKLPGGDGLSLYGKIAQNLDVIIRVLERRSDFKVMQRPSIYTANNRTAVISSGKRIAVPTNTFQSGANTGQTQSTNIDYQDVVLELRVTPLINSENEVTITVEQVNDNTSGFTEIDGNEIPNISTQTLSTTVTVSNGQTVVLGGLITEQTTKTINGVPVLIEIPVLKHLFGRTSNSVQRLETLIFIQPRILDNTEQLVDSNIRELQRTKGGEDVMEFAVPEYPEIKAEFERTMEAGSQTVPAAPAVRKNTSKGFPKFNLFGQ